MKLTHKSLFVIPFVFSFLLISGQSKPLRSDWMKGKYGLMVYRLTPFPRPVDKQVVMPKPPKAGTSRI